MLKHESRGQGVLYTFSLLGSERHKLEIKKLSLTLKKLTLRAAVLEIAQRGRRYLQCLYQEKNTAGQNEVLRETRKEFNIKWKTKNNSAI